MVTRVSSDGVSGVITIHDDDGSAIVLKNNSDGGRNVDEFVAIRQSDQRITFGVNSDKRLQSAVAWGDPHCGVGTIQGAALTTMQTALEKLDVDAKDNGRIDDQANLNFVKQGLNSPTSAGGRYHWTHDAQANFKLKLGDMQADIKTKQWNAETALSDQAVVTFGDGNTKLFIDGITNLKGDGRGLEIRKAETGDGGWQSHGTFVVASDREMGLEGTGMLFGTEHGSTGAGRYVIDVNGDQHSYLGRGVFWNGRSELWDMDGTQLLNLDGSSLESIGDASSAAAAGPLLNALQFLAPSQPRRNRDSDKRDETQPT